MKRSLALTAAVVAAGTLAIGASADTRPTARAAAAKAITPERVGQVHLGDTHADLRASGLVGVLKPGCELSGPNVRSARLLPPLKGFVDYTQTNPRKVRRIIVRDGAKARGVGIGATIAQIKNKFPKAKVDHSTEDLFGITLVRVPKNGGGKLQFSVRVSNGKTNAIGVPAIPFCE